jgi:DNA replication protein DnaC
MIVGPIIVGKTFLAFALSHSAIPGGHGALYVRVPRLIDDLSVARADGRFASLMFSLSRTDILILNEPLLRSLTEGQAADLLEVVKDHGADAHHHVTTALQSLAGNTR